MARGQNRAGVVTAADIRRGSPRLGILSRAEDARFSPYFAALPWLATAFMAAAMAS